jgi:prevent-host-death family protein
MKRVSIARARDSLTRLVREVETGRTIELTRRERPVAALIPLSELRRLTAARPLFAEAVSDFRASLSPADLKAIGKAFAIPRERSPGREVEL